MRLDEIEVGRERRESAAPVAVPETSRDEARAHHGSGSGLRFYGVVRSRVWRSGGLAARDDAQEVTRVRYRDLEALVRPVPFTMPEFDAEAVREHQRTIERAMRRSTILPAPFGIVFRGRRALIRFLEDQYLALDEGLSLFDGHWEVRVHIQAAVQNPEPAVSDVAVDAYTELRRFARAAIPFPRGEAHLLSAAFLVDRTAWVDFVERTDDLGVTHPELTFDVTGPWPPYDFVRIVG